MARKISMKPTPPTSGAFRYANSSGRSNVVSYELGADFIILEFGDGSHYVYTHASTGASEVNYMKRLARTGTGLNGYVTSTIKKRYARKY